MGKHLIVFIVVLLTLTFTVVGDQKSTVTDNSTDGTDLEILSGNNPLKSFSQGNGSCGDGSGDKVSFNQNSSSVIVEGTLQTSNPCYSLRENLIQDEGVYTLNITSKSDGKRICVQCLGSIDYTAEVRLPDKTPLEIIHDGEKIDEFTREKEKKSFRGLLAKLLDLLGF